MENEVTYVENTLAPYNIPVERIEMPPFYTDLVDEIKSVMQAHGGKIEELKQADKLIGHVLLFPVGTIKTEIWPRIHNSRYEICFPDDFKIFEHQSIQGGNSLVHFPIDAFSEETQKKYSK